MLSGASKPNIYFISGDKRDSSLPVTRVYTSVHCELTHAANLLHSTNGESHEITSTVPLYMNKITLIDLRIVWPTINMKLKGTISLISSNP